MVILVDIKCPENSATWFTFCCSTKQYRELFLKKYVGNLATVKDLIAM